MAQIVKKQLTKSVVKIRGEDLEVSRFLTVALTTNEKRESDLEDILHTVKEGENMHRLTDQEITGSDQFRLGPR